MDDDMQETPWALRLRDAAEVAALIIAAAGIMLWGFLKVLSVHQAVMAHRQNHTEVSAAHADLDP